MDMSQYNDAYNMCAVNNYLNSWFAHKKDGHLCRPIMNWFGTRFVIASGISNKFSVEKDFTGEIECTELLLKSFFEKHKIKHCLEVGTYLGTMTLVLAQRCDKVTTVDVIPRTDPLHLWQAFGTRNIDYFVFDTQQKIDVFVKSLDFDFAYLDGCHKYESISHDFSIAKCCGRVLFHDYWSTHLGPKKFIDELPKDEISFMEPFVYWEAK